MSFRRMGVASCSLMVLVKTETKAIFFVFWARSSARMRAIIRFLSPSRIEERDGPSSFFCWGKATAKVPSRSSPSLKNSWFAFSVSM